MHSSSKQVFFKGFTFFVEENVYEPAEDSFLFAENLPVERSTRIVDVGTGCGILAIAAAKNAERVLAVDLNPHAIRCALRNAKLNGVIDKMDFVQGDLLGACKAYGKFDLILFNAPYLPAEGRDRSWLACSWSGGKSGREVIDRFIDQVPEHLSSKGRMLLMQSSLSSVDKTLQRFAVECLDAKVVARQNLPFFEEIALIEVTSRSAREWGREGKGGITWQHRFTLALLGNAKCTR
jgi:release factor glutamine methyltransferase